VIGPRWLLLVHVTVLLVVAVLPVARARPAHERAFLVDEQHVPHGRVAEDALLNVAIFVPFGLLGAWVVVPRRGLLLVVVAAAALLSLGIETGQHYLPWRYSSWIDMVANTAGATLGAVLGWPRSLTRRSRPMPARMRGEDTEP
jgi:VanZ family protein